MSKRSKPPMNFGAGPAAVHLAHLLNEVGNVGYVCKEHASKPGGFVGQAPASFVGRDVKLCFAMRAGGHEAMWVNVTGLGDAVGELVGALANEPTEPLVLGPLHIGDLIAFGVEEIAAALP